MGPNFEHYLKGVANAHSNSHPHYPISWGQAYYNTLERFQPNLAAWILGTDVDPYYKEDNQLEPFITFISTHWGIYD